MKYYLIHKCSSESYKLLFALKKKLIKLYPHMLLVVEILLLDTGFRRNASGTCTTVGCSVTVSLIEWTGSTTGTICSEFEMPARNCARDGTSQKITLLPAFSWSKMHSLRFQIRDIRLAQDSASDHKRKSALFPNFSKLMAIKALLADTLSNPVMSARLIKYAPRRQNSIISFASDLALAAYLHLLMQLDQTRTSQKLYKIINSNN